MRISDWRSDGCSSDLARARGIGNFSILCNHVLTPAAISNILQAPAVRDIDTVQIDGFLGPAHVSVVIGSQPYEYFAEEFARPVVIAGFEPLDVMQSILMLVQIGRASCRERVCQYV